MTRRDAIMRRASWLFGTFLTFWDGVAMAQGVYHDGYTTQRGTYVAPHYQSAPDHSYNNNWGVSPNVNPYNGQPGTRQPTFNDQAPTGYGGRPNHW
jgi:hypothetical protein